MTLSRRMLLAGAGTVVAGFSLRPARAATLPADMVKQPALDGWIRVDPPGTITVFTGKAELGQGILTALSQIVAEVMDVSFARIAIVAPDTARTPDEGQTSGSQSVEYGGEALRVAAGEARALLVAAAAATGRVPVERLTVLDGIVSDNDTAWSTTYWQVATEGLLHRPATGDVPQKPASQHSVIGQSIPRVDIPPKVRGGAIYVQDMRLPGMLHGRVLRPPSYAATLAGLDDGPVRTMPGVVAVVRDGSFVGVVAQREEQAIAARDALLLAARWSEHATLPDSDRLPAMLLADPAQVYPISDKGGATPPPGQSFEATYTRPYIAHASIGPSCAVAHMAADGLHVWSHTQGVFPLRSNLASLLDMPVDRVVVTHAQGSGCYGHNGADDVAGDAAVLARAVPGRPVRVQWMRDDEFAWEPYGPTMLNRVRAVLAEGKIASWEFDVWSPPHSTRPGEGGGNQLIAGWGMDPPRPPGVPKPIPQPNGSGDRNAIPLYDFPRQHVAHHFITQMPVRVSALRTLGATTNVFAIEGAMDELAAMAGADPVAFRLAHLSDRRAADVMKAVADQAKWQPDTPGGHGTGRGIGFARYKNQMAYVAVVADVTVDRDTGTVRVRHVWAAVDTGEVISPDGVRNQVEGGIIQAISWSTKEQVRFDRTRILSRDWSGYPILAFPEVPAIEIMLLDRPGDRSLGIGEASCGPAAAAIANAVFHATGCRLRDMPLSPDRVRAAWV